MDGERQAGPALCEAERFDESHPHAVEGPHVRNVEHDGPGEADT